MKKLLLTAAICAATVSANAQTTVKGSKFLDNWFVGVNGGVYEPTRGQNMLADMRPLVGLELGKWFTPEYGVRANFHTGINCNNGNSKTEMFGHAGYCAFDFQNITLDGMVNLSNLFFNYQGQPRKFEVILSGGMGWKHDKGMTAFRTFYDNDHFVGKLGFDLNYNVTEAVAISVKPAIDYCFADRKMRASQMNVNKSYLTLQAGVIYKFKNSNGTHNFVLAEEGGGYSQADIDELNARINALRGDYESQLGKKNTQIKELQDALAAERAKGKTVINNTKLAPVVIFDQGKSVINRSQQPSVQMIATYLKNHPDAKIVIKGYASPEGSTSFNQRLSEARAQAVYNMLVKTYGISESRLKQEGLGETSEIFPENDWNRVCIFVDESGK